MARIIDRILDGLARWRAVDPSVAAARYVPPPHAHLLDEYPLERVGWSITDPRVFITWFDAGDIPLMPKLFVLAFLVFFAAMAIPLIWYFLPPVKDFFKFGPVAWSSATFGAMSAFVHVHGRSGGRCG